MIEQGQITLFAFPQTDQVIGKLRPALILRALPGPHGDWLICMISSQLHHEVPEFDEIIRDTDSDFSQTGLKYTSLIRLARLAVVSGNLLEGAIGTLSEKRLSRIYSRLADWVRGAQVSSTSDDEISDNGDEIPDSGDEISQPDTSQDGK